MTFEDREKLKKQLLVHEGLRLKPYADTVGKITIGCGRNLTDVGISAVTAEQMLEEDITKVIGELESSVPWFASISPLRQRALADLTFNMGIGWIRKFPETFKTMTEGRWDAAATQLLLSRYAQQVGHRAHTIAKMLREG